MLERELPKSKIKADLHIKSRLRLLKRQYNVISKMINIGSGFEWNDEEKCVTAPKDCLMVGLGEVLNIQLCVIIFLFAYLIIICSY